MEARRSALFLAALALGFGSGLALAAQEPGQAQDNQQTVTTERQPTRMRGVTNAQRRAAAARAAARTQQRGKLGRQVAAPSAEAITDAVPAPDASAADPTAAVATVAATPDYFAVPNWAYSPIIPKFVDSLPGVGYANRNNLNNYIPLAKPITNALYPTSDYYEIAASQYTQQMHTNLLATKLWGYKDLNPSPTNPTDALNHYLGPIILAQKDRPVRILFKNQLPANGNLPIPTDTTYMGAGLGPLGTAAGNYSQTRAVLHLHGGLTPWISDGTPHQWITPPAESTSYRKGVSFQNVPDMIGTGKTIVSPAANDGMGTYFYPNQQSGRLMFYHEHAYGTTRLGVYAGLAAGYVVHDPVEDALITAGTIPNQAGADAGAVTGGGVYNWGIPLIIQDKTFVDPTTIGATDPTWASIPQWGQTQGSLWFPHVYMPNQNPADPEGVNALGRWDYGMWFWPPLSAAELLHPAIPCTSAAFPPGTIFPPGVTGLTCPGTPNPSGTPEAFMDTPIVNGQAYPYINVKRQAYRFRILNAANDRFWNLQLYYAATAPVAPATAGTVCKGTGTPALCTEVNMVEACPHELVPPVTVPPEMPLCPATATLDPVTGLPVLPGNLPCWPSTWPTDGRDGGVPDPANAGPQLIQIGTEGGILPQVALIPSQPINYEYFRRSITVLNVSDKALFMGPAERADVIIDFSQVPDGSTLILYSDSPAPVPAFDTRFDFYTGDPDQSMGLTGDHTGGAPSTLAGFGPNTRTIMQFRVSGAGTGTFSLASLQAALPPAFKSSHDADAVSGQPADYPIVGQVAYNAAFTPAVPYANAYARIQSNSLTFTNIATGATATINTTSKAIHELFEQNYGRMNALLGTELPLTSFLIQTTLPFVYVDPPTEVIGDQETQLWKITHNGVDTHAIHFHLFNVQLINRMGWDGTIKPPEANEIGWKETVRMNPLEDVLVAVRPLKPIVPFPLPDSVRSLDVTQPDGVNRPMEFTNVDPLNQPITFVNQKINFGWEYVWHCHLLGHEENDMMRPIIFQLAMDTPALTCATGCSPATGAITLNWTVPTSLPTNWTVQRSINGGTTYTTVATLNGNVLTYSEKTPPTGALRYRVRGTRNMYGGVSVNNTPNPILSVPQQSAYSNVVSSAR